ncbi:MAG: hypothetical protein AAF755_06685 [Pseudomonadota bacterium]
MAYQTVSQPAKTLIFEIAQTRLGLQRIIDFLSTLLRVLVLNSDAQKRVARIEVLQAKSDAQLAEIGLKREDIVRHAFRDRLPM